MYTSVLTIDTESTGVNPLEDRLLTIFVGLMNSDGEWEGEKHILFNPGVPISEENSAIHGITNEKAEAEGLSGERAVKAWTWLRGLIVDTVRDKGVPIVAYNAVFDLTLINAELQRHDLRPISWDDMFILDPLIVDKRIDKWRSGSRRLTDTAQVYGIEVDETLAHDASYDCLLAGQIVFSNKFKNAEELVNLKPSQMMMLQKQWKTEQAAQLQTYLRKAKKDATLIVDPAWPERFINIENS